MTYVVEAHSKEALAVLQNLASLNLLTLRPLNGNGAAQQKKATPKATATNAAPQELTIEEQLTAWANEPGLTPVQVAARTSLIPQLIEHRKRPNPNLSELAGSISKEAGKRMIAQIEQLRNEWD